VGIYLHFRLIVSGESVHFCFPVIDPYDRVMKLAHFEVSCGKWDADYTVSWRRGGSLDHET